MLQVKRELLQSTIYFFDIEKSSIILCSIICSNKIKQCRCPLCSNGKKFPCHNSKTNLCPWRTLDFGSVIVELQSNKPRVTCPVHGVVTAAVPTFTWNERKRTAQKKAKLHCLSWPDTVPPLCIPFLLFNVFFYITFDLLDNA